MKSSTIATFVITLSFLLTLNTSALATTQDKNRDNSLFNSLEQMVTKFTGIDFSGITQIVGNLFGLDNSDEDQTINQDLTQALENKPDGSYAIDEDLAEFEQLQQTKQTITDSTLSTQASEQLKQTAAATATNVETSVDLGTQSQQIDVSQQILQNLSQQAGLNAERQGVIIQQNQQAQVDRAVGNLLNARTAEELTEMNTQERRKKAAATAAATSQLGLVRLPGGINPNQTNNSSVNADELFNLEGIRDEGGGRK